MNKNVIKIINVKSCESLFRVASAMDELRLMRKLAIENGAKEPEPIKESMDAIMDVLVYKFQQLFMNEFPKYANNKMAVGFGDGEITVEVFEELLENCDHCDDDCDDDSMDISEILKDSGLETSDEHVERLADDIKNKRGGLA